MRKALMGLLMAATIATPVAAQAQDSQRDSRSDRSQRQVERRNQDRHAPRSADRPEGQRRVQRDERIERAEPGRVAVAPGGEPVDRARRERTEPEARVADHERSQNWNDRERSAPSVERQRREDRREQDRGDRRWNREGQQSGIPQGEGRRGEWRGRQETHRDWRRDWNRDWRNDRRYDWRDYRYSHRNIFRPGRYYAPYRGYSYNRFSIGFFLRPGFYASRYWIVDPWYYRLPPAYPGTRWVRYYDDVLLVDVYTGEIIDVIYDFFW